MVKSMSIGPKIIKVQAKSIFSKTKIPGCDFVLNPYVGCEHACKYCYAKFMCRWKNHGRWGDWVEVKENAPELVRGKYVDGAVYMASVSDAYQPIEKKLMITRKVLKKNKVSVAGIVTHHDGFKIVE